MKYIKTFEIFGLFSKKESNRMSGPEFLEYTLKNYKDMEENSAIFEVTLSDNYISISWVKSFSDRKGDYHITLSKRNDGFYINDFKDSNGESMYITSNGVEDIKTIDTKISEDLYKKYLKELTIISNYLIESEEAKEKNKKASIGKDGLVNLEEDPLEQIGFALNNEMSKYIGKKFKFDTLYYIWSSKSENEQIIDELEFEIKEFKFGLYHDDRGCYSLITAKCPLDNTEYDLWVDMKYKAEYVKLDSMSNKLEDIIKPSKTEKVSFRKMVRDNNYPKIDLRSMTPSEYSTIEMIKELQNILTMINEQIKK